jgi:hypothetical protein
MPFPVPDWLSLDSGPVPRARAGTFEEGTAAMPGASTDRTMRWLGSGADRVESGQVTVAASRARSTTFLAQLDELLRCGAVCRRPGPSTNAC